MIREEAWRKAKGCLYDVLSGEEADEIIKALEKEPCEDCISREDALQALCKAVHKNDDTIPCLNQRVSCLWDKTKVQDYAEEILKLPPVTPVEKQESCDDAISRQAAIDTISELNAISFYEAQEDSKECYYEIRNAIKQLPPVTLAEKVGQWIYYYTNGFGRQILKCSKCNFKGDTLDFKYCPNCGAKMEEVKE